VITIHPLAPGLLRMALELRMPLDFAASVAALPLLMSAPRGDGHTVLVIPGLAASDVSTRPLRLYLRGLGYDPLKWTLGRNLGPRPGILEGCNELLRHLRRKSDRKVSLIGWSLGGIYARELAKALPDHVRGVITLGTPLTVDPDATNAASLYRFLNSIMRTNVHGMTSRILRPCRRPPSTAGRTVSWPGKAAFRLAVLQRKISRWRQATSV